jgi:elongation factor 1-beta
MSLAFEAASFPSFRSDIFKYLEAEQRYYSGASGSTGSYTSPAVESIKQARKAIESVLNSVGEEVTPEMNHRFEAIEKENAQMRATIAQLIKRIEQLEGKGGSAAAQPQPKQAEKKDKDSGEEDIDLFGSDDEEDAEKEKIKEERLKAYAEKKQKKPGPIAKSSVIMDVKPWDDETNMKEMEKLVRAIQMDGLVWGASKLVDLAYGIKKLQIMCVVEDEKVSVEELQERIQENEELVQSVDIAAFNKI